jgi:hypothetical protein
MCAGHDGLSATTFMFDAPPVMPREFLFGGQPAVNVVAIAPPAGLVEVRFLYE